MKQVEWIPHELARTEKYRCISTTTDLEWEDLTSVDPTEIERLRKAAVDTDGS